MTSSGIASGLQLSRRWLYGFYAGIIGLTTLAVVGVGGMGYYIYDHGQQKQQKEALYQESLKQVDYNQNHIADFNEVRDLGIALKLIKEDEVIVESKEELSDRIKSDVDFDVLEKFVEQKKKE
ncbi:MAG: hypothetical protein KKA65_05000 [Nanoarchaeota archaeon]|nr:hypothetical protein [Nanoarchaeota archaeon]MBU4241924.1 hypothetical protein [Nanoarchaeota archaeon]MBU4351979.1 hypothetical protein [Nanoarchaeota archaeon]MBU4456833.1 hypothetical protein [Nanoarchaeota archaeon]MCG2719863.1 hypothetical protein [Nanoarchaeota archaeon]